MTKLRTGKEKKEEKFKKSSFIHSFIHFSNPFILVSLAQMFYWIIFSLPNVTLIISDTSAYTAINTRTV